jgi:hypothetical protein
MARLCLIAGCLFTLVACGVRAPPPHAQERAEIIAAVLAKQPDLAAEREVLLVDYPDQRGYFDELFDHRLCVARETAGSNKDFAREDMDKPGLPPNPSILSRRWAESASRFPITAEVTLPKHLRWDDFLTVCPNGVLRLGNPVIADDQARVYVENKCSGWCGWGGWGGEVILRRSGGHWLVDQEVNWWQA